MFFHGCIPYSTVCKHCGPEKCFGTCKMESTVDRLNDGVLIKGGESMSKVGGRLFSQRETGCTDTIWMAVIDKDIFPYRGPAEII